MPDPIFRLLLLDPATSSPGVTVAPKQSYLILPMGLRVRREKSQRESQHCLAHQFPSVPLMSMLIRGREESYAWHR